MEITDKALKFICKQFKYADIRSSKKKLIHSWKEEHFVIYAMPMAFLTEN
jgi:hypothetical protein